MDDSLASIEKKLNHVTSMIERLPCFGGHADAVVRLGNLEKTTEQLTGLVRRLTGNTMPERDFYGVKEAAIFLGYTEGYVRELLRDGKLDGEKMESVRQDGKEEWLVKREELERYIRRKRPKKDSGEDRA